LDFILKCASWLLRLQLVYLPVWYSTDLSFWKQESSDFESKTCGYYLAKKWI